MSPREPPEPLHSGPTPPGKEWFWFDTTRGALMVRDSADRDWIKVGPHLRKLEALLWRASLLLEAYARDDCDGCRECGVQVNRRHSSGCAIGAVLGEIATLKV